jgi:hypothetical protein
MGLTALRSSSRRRSLPSPARETFDVFTGSAMSWECERAFSSVEKLVTSKKNVGAHTPIQSHHTIHALG